MPTVHVVGIRYGAGPVDVTVNGLTLLPARSQRLRNHSPDGFQFGYAGSGPAQLALAILLEAGLPEREALALYQRFKFAFLANVQGDRLDLSVDVHQWAAHEMKGNYILDSLYPR